jgi:hypothetical protein
MDIEITWNYKKLIEMQIHKYKNIFRLISLHFNVYILCDNFSKS